jgi:hypothetical protein
MHRVGRQLRDCCMIAPVLALFRYPIVLAKATFPTCLPFATKSFRVKGCCIIQTSTNIYNQTLIYFPRERPHDQACGRQWGSDMHDSPVIAPCVSLTQLSNFVRRENIDEFWWKWHIVSKRCVAYVVFHAFVLPYPDWPKGLVLLDLEWKLLLSRMHHSTLALVFQAGLSRSNRNCCASSCFAMGYTLIIFGSNGKS